MRWGLASAAATLLLGLWGWSQVSAAVPICDRAQVNGRLISLTTPIAGTITERPVQDGTWVKAGTRLATVRNSELDTLRLGSLRERSMTLKSRILAQEASLRRAQTEHDRLAQELAEVGPVAGPGATQPSGEAATLALMRATEQASRSRLREEYAARVIELTTALDDQRQRQREMDQDIASEERRLEQLREATIEAPVEGIVWRIAESDNQAAGHTVVTMIDASSLVIDAELPVSAEVQRGGRASVRLGADVLEATVEEIGPDANRTRDLARSPAVGADAKRVLLKVTNRQALGSAFDRPARIAFTGVDGGLLTWLGVKLRF